MTNPPQPAFIKLNPLERPRLRLFCFPYAGAGIAAFRPLVVALGDGVELIAVQPPGRGTRLREQPFKRMTPLVAQLSFLIQPLLDRPFLFFGHSLGALVAFELTRELRRMAVLPRALIVSATISPQLPNTNLPLHGMDDTAFLAELARLKGMPPEILTNRELLEIVLPAVRADFEILETYHYTSEPPLGIPLATLGATNDPRANLQQLEAWREQTTEAFDLKIFPGGHFYFSESDQNRQEFQGFLGQKVQEAMQVY